MFSATITIPVIILILVALGASNIGATSPTIVVPEQEPTMKTTTTTTVTVTTTQLYMYIQDCKRYGFDPQQLSCSSCNLLPIAYRRKCEECCQEYISLESQSKRYRTAILIDTGYSKGVKELLKEDKDKIYERKTGLHIVEKRDDNRNDLMMMMMMNVQPDPDPSIILWFEQNISDDELLVSIEKNLDFLTEKANEVMSLDGLGRDDLREMLFDLLPEKE